MPADAIEVDAVSASYGRTEALRDVTMSVGAGELVGLLGPNGAGKTTLVRVLATQLRPRRGQARVAGYDVVRQAVGVRRSIGWGGQHATLDYQLTGRDNLTMIAELYGLRGAEVRRRVDEMIERLSLTEVAGRPARTYSGGMNRRLDLGASLVGRPVVLLLDEPTTGLDPRSRLEVWGLLRELLAEGRTILLTTQDLDEADQLSRRIVLLDQGAIAAIGTPAELKARVGHDVIEVTLADPADVDTAVTTLTPLALTAPTVDRVLARVTAAVATQANCLATAVRLLDQARIDVADVALHRPSLEDVFFALARPGSAGAAAPSPRAPEVLEADRQ